MEQILLKYFIRILKYVIILLLYLNSTDIKSEKNMGKSKKFQNIMPLLYCCNISYKFFIFN